MIYSVDTDILIHLHRYYPKSDYPKEWHLFETLLQKKIMRFSRQVYIDISKKDDFLSQWIKNYTNAIYEDTQAIQIIVARIVNKYSFAYDPHSTKNNSDPFVLAVAEHLKGTVLTDEGNGHLNEHLIGNFELMRKSPNKVKLNLICYEEGIPCISLFQFLAQRSTGYTTD